jgi:hypothetical protein
MQHNFALPAGELRFVDYVARFGEYCAHADECQRLGDCYPAIKQQYEGLASQWRELATQAVH